MARFGMEAADTKGKLLDHGFQQRLQPGFTDRGRGADHLPLGVHGIDVVDALDAIAIPLMHRIEYFYYDILRTTVGHPPTRLAPSAGEYAF